MKTPPLGMTQDNFCAVVRAFDPNATDIKTETRRLLTLKGRTQEEVNEIQAFYQDGDDNWIGVFGTMLRDPEWVKKAYPKGSNQGIKSPLQIGDRCYLTEPTQIESAPDQALHCVVNYFWNNPESLWKEITLDDKLKIESRKSGIKSKQIARFMLKSFARYWVEIVDVRLERLLDITEEAAIAEGIKRESFTTESWTTIQMYWDYIKQEYSFECPIKSYVSEIEMIHGKAIANSNPWLWVYKFKLIEGK
jgi:hypothetical protein